MQTARLLLCASSICSIINILHTNIMFVSCRPMCATTIPFYFSCGSLQCNVANVHLVTIDLECSAYYILLIYF